MNNDNFRKVKAIPQERIFSSVNQPRKLFDEESLHELARNIEYCGLMQPVVVRKVGARFEIVAGERRYRACVMAGFREIPCMVTEASDELAEIMALSENVQRKNLDCFEVAESLGRMIKKYKLTQEECARRLGKSQSAVANKLRLLQLDKKLIALIRRDGLTERHARALLRIGDERLRVEAEKHMAAEGMNAMQAEAYAAALSSGAAAETASPAERHRVYVIKDIRVFFNSVSKAVDTMREAGIAATMERGEENENLVLTVRIPKQPQRQPMAPSETTAAKHLSSF